MSEEAVRINMLVWAHRYIHVHLCRGKGAGSQTRGHGIETRKGFSRIGRQSVAVRQHAAARQPQHQHLQRWRWRWR